MCQTSTCCFECSVKYPLRSVVDCCRVLLSLLLLLLLSLLLLLLLLLLLFRVFFKFVCLFRGVLVLSCFFCLFLSFFGWFGLVWYDSGFLAL